MIRTTTLIVSVAAATAALTWTQFVPASNPAPVAASHMGKTAQQWHRIALERLKARDWYHSRLGERTRELRSLRRYVTTTKPYSVSYAIKLASTTFGVSEYEMNRVASCESGHSPTASNGQYRGVFQEGPMFERGRYGQAGFSVWDPLANSLTAAETVSREGWKQWSCAP